VTINEPPESGVVAVSPGRGQAVRTEFTIRTSSWQDDVADYPLQYTLFYYLQSPDEPQIVKGGSAVPYVDTVLGQGAASPFIFCAGRILIITITV
jgi:hypothetical protein